MPEPIRLSRAHGSRTPRVSFEFFPPKTAEMDATLWASIQRLAPLGPTFVSVTYGAGGTTRERTHATVKRIKTETNLHPAAHLTCVAASRAEVDEVAAAYREAGVRHVVALRGDPVAGPGGAYEAHPDGYASSCELTGALHRAGFEVSVSAYPETHPEAGQSMATELDHLKRKVDAGANRAITQFFFDNAHYLRYLERVRAAGIDLPIVPGILPVQNFKQMVGFAGRCGASVPAWLAQRFEGLDGDPATRQLVAAAIAAEQVLDLVDHGVDEFHFYTMNRADLVFAICRLLGLRSAEAAEAQPAARAA